MVVAIDVRQGAGSRQATGTFRFVQPGSGVQVDMAELGQLQTARNWASVTGRARIRPGEAERSV